jgi:hypothetical protein
VPVITEGYAIKAHPNELKSSPVYSKITDIKAILQIINNGLVRLNPYLEHIDNRLPMAPTGIKYKEKFT